MKKTFELISVWLMATMLCCNLTACSSSDGDDNDDGTETSDKDGTGGFVDLGKRLVSIKCYQKHMYRDEYYLDSERRFEYDESGRIVQEEFEDRFAAHDITTYEYSAEKIIKRYNNDVLYEYSLKDGRIVNESYKGKAWLEFIYDGNKLIQMKYVDDIDLGSTIITWNGDNIASMEDYRGVISTGRFLFGKVICTYSDIKYSKGWMSFDFISEAITLDDILYNQGYYGKCLPNLFSLLNHTHEINDESNKTTVEYAYSYELNDGYVEKVYEKTDGYAGYYWEYTWEDILPVENNKGTNRK